MEFIPGSSPKKLIKRTNPNNPTLVSYSITTLFNPEYLMPSEERDHIKRSFSDNYGKIERPIQRSRSTMIFNQDSLEKAQSEFMNRKFKSPSPAEPSLSPSKKLDNMQNVTGCSSLSGISNVDHMKKFNYGNFKCSFVFIFSNKNQTESWIQYHKLHSELEILKYRKFQRYVAKISSQQKKEDNCDSQQIYVD